MDTSDPFDPTFDFLAEAGNEDPDKYSPTLKAYHQRLWSKPLPGGDRFDLIVNPTDHYLNHTSPQGDFCLTSDAGIPTWKFWTRPAIADIVRQVPTSEIEEFYRVSYQMGGMIVFPCNRVDGQHTINQARGVNWQIADRLDLTVECIRRHYAGETSPLTDSLARYDKFFALFDDFKGYTEFFLLQDLLSADRAEVKVFPPFHGFDASPLPATVGDYLAYRDHAVRFVMARNRRMSEWVATAE
jgi:hypothetical protein